MEEWINKIIEDCDNLQAEDTMVVTEFGKNKDLTLHILKDTDYQPDIDEDSFNMVMITTEQNGKYVDDTNDTHIIDGSLYEELERIYDYKDFKLL